MYLHPHTGTLPQQRREHPRLDIQCRARIRIGTRQYAGYLHNISQGGAKLRTITPIRGLGKVILRLPDMPAMQCRLRWSDSYIAGVSFERTLTRAELVAWSKMRPATVELDLCSTPTDVSAPA